MEFGASVIVASSSQARVDDAITRLKESGDASRIAGYTIDLRGGTDGIKGIESRLTKFFLEQVKEPFDHFVSTAGDSISNLTLANVDLELEQASGGMNVRYWAPFAACKILQNYGLLKEGGSITLISGVRALRPRIGALGAAGE